VLQWQDNVSRLQDWPLHRSSQAVAATVSPFPAKWITSFIQTAWQWLQYKLFLKSLEVTCSITHIGKQPIGRWSAHQNCTSSSHAMQTGTFIEPQKMTHFAPFNTFYVKSLFQCSQDTGIYTMVLLRHWQTTLFGHTLLYVSKMTNFVTSNIFYVTSVFQRYQDTVTVTLHSGVCQ